MVFPKAVRLFVISLISFGLFSVAATVQAATFTVTKEADTADGTCDSDCSLREAIVASELAGGADTIILPAGEYVLSNGQLSTTQSFTIQGDSPQNTIIDANQSNYGISTVAAQVTISNVTVQNANIAGIIIDSNAEVLITDSIIQDNGIGIYSGGGSTTLTVQNTVIKDNRAPDGYNGSAIFFAGDSTLAILNSTIVDNTENTDTSGAITLGYNTANVSIAHTTISNNVGGGLHHSIQCDGDCDSLGSLQIKNSIIANNVATNGITPLDCSTADGKTIVSLGYNILETNCSGYTSAETDIIDQDPSLESLADNGGTTKTMALEADSIARDIIPSIACTDTNGDPMTEDQRGVSRPQNTLCDIGAYEFKDLDSDDVASEDDCDDSDSTVSEDQTYYSDSDGDGLGSNETTSVCSSTAPDGYTDNSDDTNDAIKNNGVEISGDSVDNDGDSEVDEVNTLSENGIHPEYGTYDPNSQDAYAASVSKIEGAKNGRIRVTYKDNSVYRYDVYDIDTDSKTKVKSFNSKGYLIVLQPKGKKVALMNGFTGEKLSSKKLSDDKWKYVGLKIAKVQGKNVVLATTKKKDGTVKISLVKVKLSEETFKKLSKKTYVNGAVDTSKTKGTEKNVQLRNSNSKTIKTYKVTEEFDLVE